MKYKEWSRRDRRKVKEEIYLKLTNCMKCIVNVKLNKTKVLAVIITRYVFSEIIRETESI